MVKAKKVHEIKPGKESLARRASGLLSKPVVTLSVGALEQALLVEFPMSDAEIWDRGGMLVGDPSQQVKGVAVALDPTLDVINYAADTGANVLITHHPAYLAAPASFRPGVCGALSPGAGVWAGVQRGVALMAFHTALDVSIRAQRVLPSMLGLDFRSVLVPLANDKRKGYGQLCEVSEREGLTFGQLAARCTSVFARPPRAWGNFSRDIFRVVTCTGSVGDVGRAALRAHADCLVCGEIKYHEALELSQAGLAILDLGHDTSELPLVAELAAAIKDAGVPAELVELIDQRDMWAYPESFRV